MEVIRCCNCNKKLAEAEFIRLAIKCPRCGAMNHHQKAIEPPTAPRAQKERHDEPPDL